MVWSLQSLLQGLCIEEPSIRFKKVSCLAMQGSWGHPGSLGGIVWTLSSATLTMNILVSLFPHQSLPPQSLAH
jgi:hypothetical protein